MVDFVNGFDSPLSNIIVNGRYYSVSNPEDSRTFMHRRTHRYRFGFWLSNVCQQEIGITTYIPAFKLWIRYAYQTCGILIRRLKKICVNQLLKLGLTKILAIWRACIIQSIVTDVNFVLKNILPPSENIRRFVKMGPVRKYKALHNKLWCN